MDCYVRIHTHHCQELMKSVGSHGSLPLLFMMEVTMVGYLVSDSHKVLWLITAIHDEDDVGLILSEWLSQSFLTALIVTYLQSVCFGDFSATLINVCLPLVEWFVLRDPYVPMGCVGDVVFSEPWNHALCWGFSMKYWSIGYSGLQWWYWMCHCCLRLRSIGSHDP